MELSIEQALHQGVAAQNIGDLQKAEGFYREILGRYPKHPDASHNLGLIAISVNQIEVALPLFKTALEVNPMIEQFWVSYVDALVKDNQIKDAKQTIKKAVKKGFNRKKLETLLSQSNLISDTKVPSKSQIDSLLKLYQSGRLADVEKLALLIIKNFPSHYFAWQLLASVLGQCDRDSEAANAFETLLTLIPQDAVANYNFGNTLNRLGRFDDAEVRYRQAIALKNDFAEAHGNLANMLQQLGRLGQAITSYTRAIELRPDDAETHKNLGSTLLKLDRLDEAEAVFRKAIALKPDFADAHNYLGSSVKELGRLDEAEAVFRRAIELKPDFSDAHNNLGVTLQGLGRLDDAEDSYTQAIRFNPESIDSLTNRWLILFSKKCFESALRDAQSLLTNSIGQFELITLYALGRIDEIYKRIAILSGIDGQNINIAAFSSFIAIAEKRNTTYNFCPNPMDFIYYSNLSAHIKNSTAFISEVIEELGSIATTWEPSGKSTVSGFQSTSGANLLSSSSKNISKIKSIIVEELKAYYSKYHSESCLYISKWPNDNFLFGWHVILKKQGHQTAHIHPAGWLSGVIYLKVVPSRGKDEGAIEFGLNGQHYSHIHSPKLTFQPKVGDMVLFPSSLHHRTIPFMAEADRIIISFDLIPSKKIKL